MEILILSLKVFSVLLMVYMTSYEAAPAQFIAGDACGAKPAEIFFLLDSSSSIWSVDFKKQLEFVKKVVDTFEIGPNKTRVGVASFSYRYHEDIGLDRYNTKEDLKAAVTRIPQYLGGTETYDALDGVRTKGLSQKKVRPGIARILIVLTDGESYNAKKTKEAAKKVKDDGIVVFAVGIGSQTDKDELAAIASTPKHPEDKYLFEVGNFDQLDDTVKEKLTTKACEVEIQKEDEKVKKDDEKVKDDDEKVKKDDAKDKKDDVKVQKDDDSGPICGANNIADVMFVVDPAEVGQYHTSQIYKFIGNVVTDFNMGKDNIKVGLESRNCGAANISLDKYDNGRELAKAFRSTKVSGLSHMLKRLRTHAYREENGGRNIARHMAVVFVDDSIYDRKTVLDEARRTKVDDVELFVVAIGDSVVDDELKALCSSPTERHIIRVPSYESLMKSKPEFMKKFCHGL